jgi:hypothetical protein
MRPLVYAIEPDRADLLVVEFGTIGGEASSTKCECYARFDCQSDRLTPQTEDDVRGRLWSKGSMCVDGGS